MLAPAERRSGLENQIVADAVARDEWIAVLRGRLATAEGQAEVEAVLASVVRLSTPVAVEMARRVYAPAKPPVALLERMERALAIAPRAERATEHATALLDLYVESGDTAALAQAAARWSETDPAAALAWAHELYGTGRETAITSILATWMRREPLAAAEWIAAHESEPRSDRRILQLVEEAPADRSHAALATWAELIRDTPMRNRALDRVVTTWARHDETGALAFLAGTTRLEPEEKHALRERIAVHRVRHAAAATAPPQ